MNPAKATLVKASSASVHAVTSLGRLQSVHTYATWHSEHAAVKMRFERGTVETSVAELHRWQRICREALSKPCEGVDLSGSLADLDDQEVW